jgi:hypothetical protein
MAWRAAYRALGAAHRRRLADRHGMVMVGSDALTMTNIAPIPLSSPTNIIYAYACPRCHVVATAGEPMVYIQPDQEWFADLVEQSRAKAAKCCLCSDCGHEVGDRGLYCKACHTKHVAERDASVAAHEAEYAQMVQASMATLSDVERSFAMQLRVTMVNVADNLFNFGLSHGGDVQLWDNLVNNHLAPLDARELTELSTLADGWWRWNNEVGATLFVPMAEWLQHAAHSTSGHE